MECKQTYAEIDHLFWKIALNDDEEAFKKLFTDFFAPLCVYAHYFVEDKNLSEDIVQEVFFCLWKNRKKLDMHSSTRNFLVTSVKNSCIDHLRKKEVEARYVHFQSDRSGSYEEEDVYTASELENVINTALYALPEKLRTVFELSRFEGLTYSEIAEKQQISVKTVEAYMTKSLKYLRTELKDYLPFIFLFLYP